VFISSAGAVGFDFDSLEGESGTNYVPSPDAPDNFIAPYLAPLKMNSGDYHGQVYYLRGGTAPNRYFAVEWHQVEDGIGGVFTFEAILLENGNIFFQYQDMSHNGSYYCGTATAIEDSAGLDGLAYLQGSCNRMEDMDGKAVKFHRPIPTARVSIFPKEAGAFGIPGQVVQFNNLLRNTGELGTDTYDILPTSSWPMTLYDSNGVLLNDTNGNGIVDTGSIAPGASKTIVSKVSVPITATMGQSNGGQMIIQSTLDAGKTKTILFPTAVSNRFAQSYTSSYSPHVGLYSEDQQELIETATDFGYYPSVTTAPNGNIIQVWNQLDYNNISVREIYYTILTNKGDIAIPSTRLTNHDAATMSTYDHNPSVVVAPNGNIAVIFGLLTS